MILVMKARTLPIKMEEKERKFISHGTLGITTRFLVFVYLATLVPRTAFAENSLQAPRFTTSSTSSSILRLGNTKIIQCQAFGNPTPQFRWLKDGHPLTEYSTDAFYKIISASLTDEGSYRCIAQNKVGSILSEEIRIVVAYMNVFEDEQDEKNYTVVEGRAAVIDLPPIESKPAPEVTWDAPDRQLYTQKYVVPKSNQLVILASEASDEGYYRARAINAQEGKEENSAYIRLTVVPSGEQGREIEPEFVVAPADARIVKGAPQSTLDCVANARPLHELETLWYKDGVLVENDASMTFNDIWNRSLTLISANAGHSGTYECQVSLKSERAQVKKAQAKVLVLEKPKFVATPRAEVLGEYGGETSLACDVVGIPMPNITWYHNSEVVDLEEGRYVVQEDNSLRIKRLLIQDNGMFQCFARSEAGESSISTWVKVKTATPIMELAPQNMTVLDGKDATLSCRAVGAPTPNITWIYNNEQNIETSNRVQVLDTGDLLIAAVKEADSGAYTCTRANEAGEVHATAYLTVLVRTQIIQPPVDTNVLLGHTATLQCKVSSDPSVPYHFNWYQNKAMIKRGQRVSILQDGTLEIKAVRAADVGSYTCAVTSAGGNETRSAKLSVIELPYPPTNVQAERVANERTVNVSWIPGFDGNSAIRQFVVQKREIPELGPIPDPLLNWITEISNVSSDKRWILLANLKAAASYQFRVSAINSVGEGSPSTPSNEVMLPQEAPSGPPVGFVGSARSQSEIITQWQPPLEEHRNGQILGYIIRYRLYGYNESPWTIQNITNEAQRNYLIQDLITWKDYIVQIAAYNNKGVGDYTDGAKIKTKEGVPEAPPTIQKLKAINSTAIKIRWQPPNPQKINGINQGYKIQAWQTDPKTGEAFEARMMRVHPNLLDPNVEQTAIMAGLDKYTDYNITVLCFTDPGDGETSEPVAVKTREDVPDEVASLQFDDISDRAVKVLWRPPKRTNGVLVGYQIQYEVKDRPETLKTRNLTHATLSLKITDLQATTHYKFAVTAWTATGPSLARIAVIQSGVEPVLPQPPSKLALSNIEAFSVVLQFTPGFDGNSSIAKWTVQAQTTRNATWFTLYEISDPDATTITVTGLVPFSTYKLRLIANNVVGASEPSKATKEFQTIQAPPAHPPRNVTVRAMSATELRVRWIPLQQIEWFGNPKGYNISCIELRTGTVLSALIDDHTANSHVVHGLEEFALYGIQMAACNEVGCSGMGSRASERTRESVPSMGPRGVTANATSSTTIVVKWGDVPNEHQNGLIEGFKVYYAPDSKPTVQHKLISSNSTHTTTLTELRKYVNYRIQVLAYTRLGDGTPSTPAVSVRTFEDVPGPPSNVSFPDVSVTSARVIWDVPEDPNGDILGYKVTYHIKDSNVKNKSSMEFKPTERTYRFTQLDTEKFYLFSVTARTQLGWGTTAHALVYTTNNRQPPQPPSQPQISNSQIQSQQITFSWTPGPNGFAPLRYYTVQKRESTLPWTTLPERVDPSLTSYTVTDLKPFTNYYFRIRATNDIGPSPFSNESNIVQTYPAAPSKPITNLKVIPITTTSVEVSWTPIDEVYFSGESRTGGYRVTFEPVPDYLAAVPTVPIEVPGVREQRMVLTDLQPDMNYEIKVVAFNAQGAGPVSAPVSVYVGEAVPTGEPRDIEAEALSGTEVRLKWKPPQQAHQNGELLGYKIFYLVISSPQEPEADAKFEEEIEVVAETVTAHSLVFLDKFTEYRIQILAFNPAGDGPRSRPINVKTFPGLPGGVQNLRYTEITMNALLVEWDPPKKRNGNIIGYTVTYETAEENDKFSKQVKQKVNGTRLQVQALEEEVTYTFTVRAQTIDYGPAISSNVTTGPQIGSPAAPKELFVEKTLSSVDLRWMNGVSGKAPILGYYVEAKRKDDSRWQTVVKTTNGVLEEFSVSYQNLLPSTSYLFRVISYNRFGISYPVIAAEAVLTPSKLYMEYGYYKNHTPFYRQTWFMVALAATSIIIIIMIIAILCVKSKSYKYKQEAQKTLEESMAMSMADQPELAMDYYRSRTGNGAINSLGTLSKRSTMSRKPVHPPPTVVSLGKSPPRPSPASVPYHSDEESLKGYDDNVDDSSVTEKPSEMSSSESQGSESENESVRSDPHSFVNHYANVNDTLRQSWKRQKPVRNYSSYTDSEPEGSAVVSLNGGQIIMNNMARSRAPLPGFSSFV